MKPNLQGMEGSVYTKEYQVFLALLRKAREDSGLSQRELAEKLQKSYSYVAKLETGYSSLSQISCWHTTRLSEKHRRPQREMRELA
jgi:DNA-binding XRE family transcriptional regulator